MKLSQCHLIFLFLLFPSSIRSARYKFVRQCRGPHDRACRGVNLMALKEMQFYRPQAQRLTDTRRPAPQLLPRPSRLRTPMHRHHQTVNAPQYSKHQQEQQQIQQLQQQQNELKEQQLQEQQKKDKNEDYSQESRDYNNDAAMELMHNDFNDFNDFNNDLETTTSYPDLPPLTDIPSLELFAVDSENGPFSIGRPSSQSIDEDHDYSPGRESNGGDYGNGDYPSLSGNSGSGSGSGSGGGTYGEPQSSSGNSGSGDNYFDPDNALDNPSSEPLDDIRANIFKMSFFSKDSTDNIPARGRNPDPTIPHLDLGDYNEDIDYSGLDFSSFKSGYGHLLKPTEKPAPPPKEEGGEEPPVNLKDAMGYFDAFADLMYHKLPQPDNEPEPPKKKPEPPKKKPSYQDYDYDYSKPSKPKPKPEEEKKPVDDSPAPGFEEAQKDEHKLDGVMKWYYDNMPTQLMSSAEEADGDKKKPPPPPHMEKDPPPPPPKPQPQPQPSYYDQYKPKPKPEEKPKPEPVEKPHKPMRPMYNFGFPESGPPSSGQDSLPIQMETGPPPPSASGSGPGPEQPPAPVQDPAVNNDPGDMLTNDIFPSGFSHMFADQGQVAATVAPMTAQTLSDFGTPDRPPPSGGGTSGGSAGSCAKECMCVCPSPPERPPPMHNPWSSLGSGFGAAPAAPPPSGEGGDEPPRRNVNMNISLYPCARTAAYQLNLGLRLCKRRRKKK